MTLRFWLIVYLGNLAGAIFVGFMLNAADVIGPAQGQRLAEIIVEKMRFEQMGAEGWFRVVASGVLANWLVGMAAFLATAARTVSGKILEILLPILAFVALGVKKPTDEGSGGPERPPLGRPGAALSMPGCRRAERTRD